MTVVAVFVVISSIVTAAFAENIVLGVMPDIVCYVKQRGISLVSREAAESLHGKEDIIDFLVKEKSRLLINNGIGMPFFVCLLAAVIVFNKTRHRYRRDNNS